MPDQMTAADILRAARAKIERPENWTAGALARYASGAPIYRQESCALLCAVQWWAEGAVWAVSGDNYTTGYWAIMRLKEELPYGKECLLHDFNDAPRVGHADILALFTRAIAAAEKETP